MLFSDIIGQEEVKEQLRKQLREERVAHAQLFYGPEGVGKMPMALAFAQALLCPHRKGAEADATCPACRMVANLQHPDLHFVFPVIGAKDVSEQHLDAWRAMWKDSPYFDAQRWYRQLSEEGGKSSEGNQQPQIHVSESEQILRKISLTSQQGGYKVMIIWQPEQMNVQTANKLLKILEEPTPRTVFILVSDHAERLLPTILSRTQRVEFRPLSVAEMSEALQTRNALQSADASRIARQVGGNYVRALRQIHIDEDAEEFFDLFVQLMRLCYMRKIKDLYQWAETIASWKRERQKHFLEYCQRLVRENFVFNFGRPELNSLSQREADFSRNFARFVNERNVMGIMNELSLAQRDIAQNVSARMVFFDLAIKMIMLLLK